LNFKSGHLLCYDEKFYKFLNDILIQKDFFDKLEKEDKFERNYRFTRTFSKIKKKSNLSNGDLFVRELEKFGEKKIENPKFEKFKKEKNFDYYLKNFDLKEFNPMSYFLKELKEHEANDSRVLKDIDSKNNTHKNRLINKDKTKISFKNSVINDRTPINQNIINNINDSNSINNENKKNLNLLEKIQCIFNNKNYSKKNFENLYLGIFYFQSEKNKIENFEYFRKNIQEENKSLKDINNNQNSIDNSNCAIINNPNILHQNINLDSGYSNSNSKFNFQNLLHNNDKDSLNNNNIFDINNFYPPKIDNCKINSNN